jgi:predicted enzyme related to lactoylglutathione lyase
MFPHEEASGGTDMANALNWFEIPALDADRARKFYETVLDTKMKELPEMPGYTGYKMYAFPWTDTDLGGSVMQGEGYVPSTEGVVIYLNAGKSLSACVSRVTGAGGKVLQEKVPIGENGFIAFITDTEGNKVGLHSASE